MVSGGGARSEKCSDAKTLVDSYLDPDTAKKGHNSGKVSKVTFQKAFSEAGTSLSSA